MAEDDALPAWRERARNLRQKLLLRRRTPWNWLVQTLSLCILPIGLALHSAPLLVLSLLGLLAGCLELPLPPMQNTELARILPAIERLIGLEAAWLALPLTGRKKRQTILLAVATPITAWLLWRQDLGPIGLGLAAAYLLHVRKKNIEDGIEP